MCTRVSWHLLILKLPHRLTQCVTTGCRGIAANFVLLLYYSAPLSTVKTVLVTKSSASLYWPMCMMNVINSTLWVVYGRVRKHMCSGTAAQLASWELSCGAQPPSAALVPLPMSTQHTNFDHGSRLSLLGHPPSGHLKGRGIEICCMITGHTLEFMC